MKLLIIDEISMASSDLWTDIDPRLGEIFIMIPEKAPAGLSVMAVTDLLQLPPVTWKLIFSQFSDKGCIKNLLCLQLWHLFKYVEITEDLRKNDKLFINLLNQVQVGIIDDDVDNLLKARFTHDYDENYLSDALHMYAENEPALKRNKAVLNELPGELYIIKAKDKIPDNCKYPVVLIQAAQNQNQTNTRGLTKFRKLKTCPKVMLTVNIDI